MSELVPIVLFAFAGFFTPGPNNVMLAASGANFGFWRTLPHGMGILFGFAALVLILGLGLGQVFLRYPLIHEVLRWLGAAYLTYLAWRIATAGEARASTRTRPLSFFEAAAFQFLNPKAWTLAVSALAAFTTAQSLREGASNAQAWAGLLTGSYLTELLTMVFIFCLVSPLSTSTWTLFGTAIGRFLGHSAYLRAFNLLMAILLLGSVVLMLLGQ